MTEASTAKQEGQDDDWHRIVCLNLQAPIPNPPICRMLTLSLSTISMVSRCSLNYSFLALVALDQSTDTLDIVRDSKSERSQTPAFVALLWTSLDNYDLTCLRYLPSTRTSGVGRRSPMPNMVFQATLALDNISTISSTNLPRQRRNFRICSVQTNSTNTAHLNHKQAIVV